MIITDPYTARRILDDASYGVCRWCNGAFAINQDGRLRKHDDCPQDLPLQVVWFRGGESVRLNCDELAEIAAEEIKSPRRSEGNRL